MNLLEFHRPRINEVFTPRLPDVNRSVYVERPELEKSLRVAEASMTLHRSTASGPMASSSALLRLASREDTPTQDRQIG